MSDQVVSRTSTSKRAALRRMVTPQAAIGLIVVLAMMIAMIPAPGSTAAGPPIYPDLRTATPFNLYFEYGWDGQWRLRFANTVSNHGGPLEITVDGNKRIYQNVYDALWGGNLVSTTRVGSDLIFHPTHNHFHFADFARYDLLVRDRRGAYRRSPRQSQKTTFCILDYQRVNAPGPSSPGYTTCGANYQGLSAGWGDTYMADLPDQWIVLGSSRLADGDYALLSTADPYNKLRESNESNNEGILYFSVRNGQLFSTVAPPICTVDPPSAPVGATVTLHCERFGASEDVDIRWGGPSTTPLQTVTSSSNGTVTAQVVIPEGGSGNHYIIATGRTSDFLIAAIFNTQPSMWRQFWNRSVGDFMDVELQGFSPSETVTVSIETSPGSWRAVGSTTVDNLGRGWLTISIPITSIGRHEMKATGSNSGLSAYNAVKVNPSILVVPESASAGSDIGLSLRGYGVREAVSVTIDGQAAGTIQTSHSGSTTASASQVTIPETLATGVYTVTATGQTSGGTSSTTIEVTEISLAEVPATPDADPAEPLPATPAVDDGSEPQVELPVETETAEAPVDLPPDADAGPDIDAVDDDGDGFGEIDLDASASFDPEGSALIVTWTLPDDDDLDLDPQPLAEGMTAKVLLPVGQSIVTLTVVDENGNSSQDEVIVSIEPAPTPTSEPASADGTPAAA